MRSNASCVYRWLDFGPSCKDGNHSAQGWRGSAYPGSEVKRINPVRVESASIGWLVQPLQGWSFLKNTQGRRCYANPGLYARNPVGVAADHSQKVLFSTENTIFHRFPGGTFVRMLVIVLKPSIKFFALSFGEKNRLGHRREAVPNIFRKLNTLRNAEFKNVCQGNFTHEAKT